MTNNDQLQTVAGLPDFHNGRLHGETPATETVWLSFNVIFLLALSLILNVALIVRMATLQPAPEASSSPVALQSSR